MWRLGKRFFSSNQQWHHTTILALKRYGETVIIGDGQVSHGNTRIKSDAKKVRKLSDTVYCGFAGTVADALTLMQNIEVLINKHPNQTLKNCITLAKKWRTNKMLGGLQATMILIDQDLIVELDGSGNVLEVKDTIGIGSGGQFAECAARALLQHTTMTGEQIAVEAMKIAADKCIYTSTTFVMQKVPAINHQ